jgi:chemotaxis signal transduction protein
MTEGRALCVLCRVGAERLAVRAADVHKVVGHARPCRLPRLPPSVAGITHHRGRIVTVFDAGALLFGAAPRKPEGPEARILVLDRLQRHLAVGVDRVDEIELLRLGPDLPVGPTAALRVAEHRGEAVLAVDVDRLIDVLLRVGALGPEGDGGPEGREWRPDREIPPGGGIGVEP